MNIKNIIVIFFTALIFLASCSENKEKNSESSIDEQVEMIIKVEPENINLNEIPDILTITVENISNIEWRGGYHCAIDYFNGNEWEVIYAPEAVDDELIIEPNSTNIFNVARKAEINNFIAGKYRVRFGFSSGKWYGWYGEFTIIS